MTDSLWSIDMFRCESLILKTHWVMVVMDQFTRRIIGFAVSAGDLDGPALCRMFSEAIARTGALPRYLSSDHDPLFEFHRWQANLRILDVTEVKTVPYLPLSHPFVERLIGTIRREFLDFVPFWTSRDLERKLTSFMDCYNRQRVHRGLDGAIPDTTSPTGIIHLNDYRWKPCCRDHYQLPAAGLSINSPPTGDQHLYSTSSSEQPCESG
jgi:transposase InsO family protein